MEVTHVNLNDGSCAGLAYPAQNIMSLQYHPEASPGPHDSDNGNGHPPPPLSLSLSLSPHAHTFIINVESIFTHWEGVHIICIRAFLEICIKVSHG